MSATRLDRKQTTGKLDRRALLGAAAAALGAGAISRDRAARAQASTELRMAIWANEAERAAFEAALAKYQAQHPEVAIRLEVSGGGPQFYQQIDTRLAGGQAPDIFRAQYQQIGRYAEAGALVDLGDYVEEGEVADFAASFLRAVTFEETLYALPHHTDTFALYYNQDILQKLGVEPPTSLDQSWSWQRFIEIARQIKQTGAAPYAFAMGWQNSNAYRWLPFLYQHGGQLLSDDLTRSQLATPPGIETIAWTQSWFTEQLVPPSTAMKSSEQAQNLFANGTIGLYLGGDWQIPFLLKNMKAAWGVTYMPRDVAMASDLGGNCLAVSRDSENPEVAADFIRFMTDKANMQDFVTQAQFLPVRQSLMAEPLPYPNRPEAMKVFIEQATTIPAHLISTVTLPVSSRINAALVDQLDLALTAGQDPTATAQAIDERVQSLLEG
jgi:multiple sugar transport system substrate-binding protein